MSQSKSGEGANYQRRQFLKTLGVAGGAVAAVAVSGEVMAETTQEQVEKPASQGYQETEHVRSYYKVARI